MTKLRRHFILLALGGALATAPDPGLFSRSWQTQAYSALAAVLQDPLAVLAGRSPGMRTAAALRQTKGAALAPSRAKPTERVLSAARVRPPAVVPLETADLLGALPPAVAGLLPPEGQVLPFDAAGPAIDLPLPLASFVETPPAVGSLAPGGLTTVLPADSVLPPTTTSAVPEPAVWMQLILGFGLIGVALRWRRRAPTPAVAD